MICSSGARKFVGVIVCRGLCTSLVPRDSTGARVSLSHMFNIPIAQPYMQSRSFEVCIGPSRYSGMEVACLVNKISMSIGLYDLLLHSI